MSDTDVSPEKKVLIDRYFQLMGVVDREYDEQFAKFAELDVDVLTEYVSGLEASKAEIEKFLEDTQSAWEKSELERKHLKSADTTEVAHWLDKALKRHFLKRDPEAFQPFQALIHGDPASDLATIIWILGAEDQKQWIAAVLSLCNQYSFNSGPAVDCLFRLAEELDLFCEL